MHLEKQFDVKRPRAEAAQRRWRDDETLAQPLPRHEHRDRRAQGQTPHDAQPLHARSVARASRPSTSSFRDDGDVDFEKVCDGRVWRELRGTRDASRTAARARACASRWTGAPRRSCRSSRSAAPMQEQIEQMATALRKRLAREEVSWRGIVDGSDGVTLYAEAHGEGIADRLLVRLVHDARELPPAGRAARRGRPARRCSGTTAATAARMRRDDPDGLLASSRSWTISRACSTGRRRASPPCWAGSRSAASRRCTSRCAQPARVRALAARSTAGPASRTRRPRRAGRRRSSARPSASRSERHARLRRRAAARRRAIGRTRELPAAQAAADAIAAQDPRGIAELRTPRRRARRRAVIDQLAEIDVPALVVVGERGRGLPARRRGDGGEAAPRAARRRSPRRRPHREHRASRRPSTPRSRASWASCAPEPPAQPARSGRVRPVGWRREWPTPRTKPGRVPRSCFRARRRRRPPPQGPPGRAPRGTPRRGGPRCATHARVARGRRRGVRVSARALVGAAAALSRAHRARARHRRGAGAGDLPARPPGARPLRAERPLLDLALHDRDAPRPERAAPAAPRPPSSEPR